MKLGGGERKKQSKVTNVSISASGIGERLNEGVFVLGHFCHVEGFENR